MNKDYQSRAESSTRYDRVFIDNDLLAKAFEANRKKKDASQRKFKQQCNLHDQLENVN